MNAPKRARGPFPAVLLACAALTACSGEGGPGGGAQAPSAESLPTILAHADASFRDGDYPEAQKAYEEALRIEPGQPRATANLATCYLKQRLVKKSEEILATYLAAHPDDATALLVQARTFVREGRLEDAAGSLRAILKINPDVVMAHYNLGLVAYRLRLYDEAEEHLKRACALKPDLPDAFYTLGMTQMALGRTGEAIDSFEQAVRIDPHHVGARFNLANAYTRAGRTAEAARAQAAYAEISGRSKSAEEKEAQIKTSSVKAIQFLLDKKYPEALEEYRALAARYPDYAPLQNQIGQILIRLDRRDEAFAALRRAADLDPKLSDPHYLLSGLYRERGDAQAAERELTIVAALETIPEGTSGY